jgi:hypothetical protein
MRRNYDAKLSASILRRAKLCELLEYWRIQNIEYYIFRFLLIIKRFDGSGFSTFYLKQVELSLTLVEFSLFKNYIVQEGKNGVNRDSTVDRDSED